MFKLFRLHVKVPPLCHRTKVFGRCISWMMHPLDDVPPVSHTYTIPPVQVVSLSDYVKELVSQFLYDRVVGAQWAERVQFKVWSMVFVDFRPCGTIFIVDIRLWALNQARQGI